jgi:hypothetical protein
LGDLVAKAQQGARGETGARELLERETEMRNLSKKAKTIIAGAAIAGLASTGVAYAYWTAAGNGTGSATTAAASTDITVVQTSNPADLAPGSGPQTLSGDFINTNPSPVKVLQVNVALDSSQTFPTGCLKADYLLVQPTPQDVTNWLVPVSTATIHGGSWVGGSIELKYTSANQDACKNLQVNLVYTTTTASGS